MKPLRLPPLILHTLPIFTAFAFTAWLIARLDLREAAIALVLGVIAGGLADMDHRAGGRVRNLFIILPTFGLCALAVQISQAYPLALFLLMAVLAFFSTMLGAIDTRYRTIGFCSLVVALYTLLADNAALPWYANPLLIMLGALICQSSMLGFQLLFPNHPVQQSLAASFRVLADYMDEKALFFAPDEKAQLTAAEYRLAGLTGKVAEAFNHSRDVLFNRLAGGKMSPLRRRQLQDFFSAQDIHERISAAHVDYQDLLTRLPHSDLLFRIERLIHLQAQACRAYARVLAAEQSFDCPPALLRAQVGLHKAWQHHLAQAPQEHSLAAVLRNLEKISLQLEKLGKTEQAQDSAMHAQDRLHNNQLSDWRQIPQRLRVHLHAQSPFFRHALRMSLMSCLCVIIVESLDLHLGYWILLTAVFVCQPNRAATRSKLVQRIIGTLIGVLVGGLLPLLAPERITLLSLLVLANTFFFYFRARNYSFSTFFITVQVFIGFALIDVNLGGAVWRRVFDTLLGAAIAWSCVQWIFPERRYQSLPQLIRNALQANADYLAVISAQLHQEQRDDLAYRASRRRVHEQAAALAGFATEQQQSQAMNAVQENYRLVSRLSALAAHRGQQNALSDSTLEPLLNIMYGKEKPDALSAYIRRLEQSPSHDSERQLLPLCQALEALYKESHVISSHRTI